jgi:hypothetical protein
MLRRRRPPRDPLAHVDPTAVSPRFAGPVVDALEARRRYAAVLAGMHDGPARAALESIGGRVDAGVLAVWDTVTRASAVEHAVSALDPAAVAHEYKQARRSGTDPDLESVLGQRFASVQRLLNALDDTEDRLRLLDARLGAAVAGAAEVALGASGTGADDLGAALDGVVDELDALRRALDDLA